MISKMPKFISKIMENPICGTFHLGHYYNLNLYNDYPECFVTSCTELFPLAKTQSIKRVLILTDDVFLLFEPNKGDTTQSLLISWAFIYSLVKMRITENGQIILEWRADSNTEIWQQYIKIDDDVDKFVEEIMDRMKEFDDIKIGGNSEKKIKENPKKQLLEEDVSIKEITSHTDINEINENIALYESSLEQNPTLSSFQTLMLLYQKVFFFNNSYIENRQ